ncbi:hypothetical protein GQE99_16235 [Maritimibacter sp. DP07]|uniref:Uracil DNA glycosylase superfamily protein n=1 Tax=Maritimibacter harenae TaxID=2606218 RepID=A0A845M6A5_9RHOB|nr:hypothetical protein [Maritimibacter harenae]MZR14569.1 hypothetical protein [Maritimibacter harenae]
MIIITAEPGDPPDAAGYRGTPADMVRNSLRIFHEAMENGGIERRGRPTPFHRNMRHILDAFWPNEALNTQLRKTWLTNAVLCPAKVTGGAHPGRVERTCVQTYLARQLELFPTAFVVALGAKAEARMRAAGLPFDAGGLHPSARKSFGEKATSWGAAARRFHERKFDGAALQGDDGTNSVSSERSVSKTLRPGRQFDEDVRTMVAALPTPTGEFFARITHHPDYDFRVGRMQSMIYFRDKKVGGLNRRASHWYFSKVFVREHGNADLMDSHGFDHVIHNEAHDYWLGRERTTSAHFEDAMVAMTGVRL